MSIENLTVGKIYNIKFGHKDAYLMLYKNPKHRKLLDTYEIEAFIVAIHDTIDKVYIYDFIGEKLILNNSNIAFDTFDNDFCYIFNKIFTTKNLNVRF